MFDLRMFESKLRSWSCRQPYIIAAGIVGSYARGEAKHDSDMDIMLLTDLLEDYIKNQSWLLDFDCRPDAAIEYWGNVTTVRAKTLQDKEIEFNFTSKDLAAIPVDSGTLKVVQDGLTLVYDPTGMLSRLKVLVL